MLIGAGKPAEYGRFGVFTNTALAIGTACLLPRRWTGLRAIVNWVPAASVVLWLGFESGFYLRNFCVDTSQENSRVMLNHRIMENSTLTPIGNPSAIGVSVEPAPFSMPPMDFSTVPVLLVDNMLRPPIVCGPTRIALATLDRRSSNGDRAIFDGPDGATLAEQLIGRIEHPSERFFGFVVDTPISWANKPFVVLLYSSGGQPCVTPNWKRQVGGPSDR